MLRSDPPVYDQRFNTLDGAPCSGRFGRVMAGETPHDPVRVIAEIGAGEGVYIAANGDTFHCTIRRGEPRFRFVGVTRD